jgi:hypothetical protein
MLYIVVLWLCTIVYSMVTIGGNGHFGICTDKSLVYDYRRDSYEHTIAKYYNLGYLSHPIIPLCLPLYT